MSERILIRGPVTDNINKLACGIARRRLDSLSRLLSGYSECVAVCLIQDKLYISANEIYLTTAKKLILYQAIQAIMGYFIKNTYDHQKNRNNIFLDKICAFSRFTKILSGIVYPVADRIRERIPILVLEGDKLLIENTMRLFGKNRYIAEFMYEYVKLIYSDFLKFENFLFKSDMNIEETNRDQIRKEVIDEKRILSFQEISLEAELLNEPMSPKNILNNNILQSNNEALNTSIQFLYSMGNSNELRTRFIAASGCSEKNMEQSNGKQIHDFEITELYQAFSTGEYSIIDDEECQQVHAEMKILDYIISHIEDITEVKDYYIGLPMRCCLQCQFMIEAANEVLKERGYQFSISTRGSHGWLFDLKWALPKRFFYGYKRKGVDLPQSLHNAIGFRAREKYENFRRQYQEGIRNAGCSFESYIN